MVRNRVRRRLREIARQVIPGQARPDLDYVLVGRQGALERDFAVMRQELVEALKRLKALARRDAMTLPHALHRAAEIASFRASCFPCCPRWC